MSQSGTAIGVIEGAFKRLESVVSHDDAIDFHSTELKDVYNAAVEIERWQRDRKSLRNMRRIEPLLKAIEQYSGPLETLCQGTPYLPWIWAPMKLLLQIAAQYTDGFDKLLDAYSQIAEALPRFDRYQKIFQQSAFQHVLALVYADILEFHRRAYKILKQRAWKLLFKSLWQDFGARFQGILESLRRHCTLVDQEAVSIDIVEASELRIKTQKDLDLRDEERASAQLRATLAWLAVEDRLQEDEFDSYCQKKFPGTCQWILVNQKYIKWVKDMTNSALLWIWGIPGSGKTVLCAHLVKTLRLDNKSTTLYYFCGSSSNSHTDCSRVLRSLAILLVRCEPALATHVSTNYVQQGISASVSQLRKLLSELLGVVPRPQILLDGLDECDPSSQEQILAELLTYSSASTRLSKVLILSRDGGISRRRLRQKPTLSLREESEWLQSDISAFIKGSLEKARSEWDCPVSESSFTKIEQELLRLSNGMFLWVQLVIVTLQYQYTEDDLLAALNRLPMNLQEVYDRIFQQMTNTPDQATNTKLWHILAHLAYAERAIREFELLSAIGTSFGSTEPGQAKLIGKGILDLCKPVVEVTTNGIVDFVHFSAKEYVRTSTTKQHINIYHGQESLLKSCLAYLLSTKVFLDESGSLKLMEEIVRMQHGFHTYAWKHWIIHLEKYADSAHGVGLPVGENIMCQLRSLLWLGKPQPNSMPNLPQSLPAGATIFQDAPDVANFLSHIFAFRDALPALEQEVDHPKDLAAELARRDPSWLGEIHRSYERHVQELLKCPNSASADCLDPQQLQSFRSTFGSQAFHCRYRACASSIISFDSQEARNNHESGHMRKYKCEIPNCFKADRGFKSPRDLKLHTQKYHPPPKIPSLTLNSPFLEPKSESDPSSLLGNRSQYLEDLRIVYAPGFGTQFTVELLHQFKTTSVCCATGISPDERYFAVGVNKYLFICSMATGAPIKSFPVDLENGGDNYIRDVFFTLDSKCVVASDESRNINIWDIETEKLKAVCTGHDQDICGLASSPDGRLIASASGDKTLRLWDMRGNQVNQFLCEDGLYDVAFLTADLVAYTSLNKTVGIVEWKTGELVQVLSGHEDSVYGLDILPKSRKILSGSLDKTAKLWSEAPKSGNKSGKYIPNGSFVGHRDYVLSVQGIEEKSWIITASKDREIRIWDIETGERLCTIHKHKNSVIRVKCCPSNRLLFVSGSGDFTACVWLIKPKNLRADLNIDFPKADLDLVIDQTHYAGADLGSELGGASDKIKPREPTEKAN